MQFFNTILLTTAALSSSVLAAPTTRATQGEIKFSSKSTAFLQLDLINAEVDGAIGTGASGKKWAENVVTLVDCIHQQADPMLQIFTRLTFKPGHPEVGPDSPIAPIASGLFDASSATQLYAKLQANPDGFADGTSKDVLLPKTRYDATHGTLLLEILKAQGVDTVVLVSVQSPPKLTLSRNANHWYSRESRPRRLSSALLLRCLTTILMWSSSVIRFSSSPLVVRPRM
jgi:hypothetical protein